MHPPPYVGGYEADFCLEGTGNGLTNRENFEMKYLSAIHHKQSKVALNAKFKRASSKTLCISNCSAGDSGLWNTHGNDGSKCGSRRRTLGQAIWIAGSDEPCLCIEVQREFALCEWFSGKFRRTERH